MNTNNLLAKKFLDSNVVSEHFEFLLTHLGTAYAFRPKVLRKIWLRETDYSKSEVKGIVKTMLKSLEAAGIGKIKKFPVKQFAFKSEELEISFTAIMLQGWVDDYLRPASVPDGALETLIEGLMDVVDDAIGPLKTFIYNQLKNIPIKEWEKYARHTYNIRELPNGDINEHCEYIALRLLNRQIKSVTSSILCN